MSLGEAEKPGEAEIKSNALLADLCTLCEFADRYKTNTMKKMHRNLS
jgi:hypothetical protein